MLRYKTKTQHQATSRLLIRKIPSYDFFLKHFLLTDFDSVMKITQLYFDLFGAQMPNINQQCAAVDLLDAFAIKVNSELFPIDLDAMDAHLYEILYAGDELNEAQVLIKGEGIDVNATGIDGLEPAIEPMFYALLPLLREDEYYNISMFPDRELDRAEREWWLKHDGVSSPPRFSWIYADRWVIHEIINNQLDPALQGLGALVDCLLRDTNNPFLDICSHTVMEELEHGYWRWQLDDILDLKELWSEAKERVNKLQVYISWFTWPAYRTKYVINALHQIERWYKWSGYSG